jgi:hypothetical protein
VGRATTVVRLFLFPGRLGPTPAPVPRRERLTRLDPELLGSVRGHARRSWLHHDTTRHRETLARRTTPPTPRSPARRLGQRERRQGHGGARRLPNACWRRLTARAAPGPAVSEAAAGEASRRARPPGRPSPRPPPEKPHGARGPEAGRLQGRRRRGPAAPRARDLGANRASAGHAQGRCSSFPAGCRLPHLSRQGVGSGPPRKLVIKEMNACP